MDLLDMDDQTNRGGEFPRTEVAPEVLLLLMLHEDLLVIKRPIAKETPYIRLFLDSFRFLFSHGSWYVPLLGAMEAKAGKKG